MAEEPTPYRPRCVNICCKSMLVFGESFEEDPEYQAGMVEFWCILTSKNLGPDNDTVNLEMCCNPERTCFQEY